MQLMPQHSFSSVKISDKNLYPTKRLILLSDSLLRHELTRADTICLPVLDPAYTVLFFFWPPKFLMSTLPFSSREKLVPILSSQSIICGASEVSISTAFSLFILQPPVNVSVKCWSVESFSPLVLSAALIPPIAITDCERSE